MRYLICTTIVLWGANFAPPILAQPSDPTAANRGLIGTGPKVDIQTSANGTLDVGGAGAANPNLTGANLRGNLGASIPQAGPGPVQPDVALPNFSFEVPNLAPNLRGAPLSGQRPTPGEIRVAEDYVLPRFRAQGGALRTASAGSAADGWRYRYFNGRWWYWKSNNAWAYWDGSRWLDRAAR